MRRSLLAALAAALLLPASVLAYTSPTWNLNGTYTIDFTCTANCSGDYIHSMNITFTSDTTGQVSGTGHYVADPDFITWTVTGQVTGWNVHLDVLYTNYLAGYTVAMDGKINQQGGMSGTAVDTLSQVIPGALNEVFSWVTTTGSVGLFSPSCEYGTYPLATLVWSGFAPGNGGVVTTTPLDATRDYFVEASGTYFAGGNGLFDIEADAEYSQDAVQRAAGAAWTDSVRNYESFGEDLTELYIDGAAVEWGAYNASHRYTLDVTPTGVPLDISANIYDLPYAYGNNTGGLCVAVYERVEFTGFFAPVDNLPTLNLVKAGSAIPVKFSLGGDWGLDVFAAGYPKSQTIPCDSTDPVDGIESTVNAGGSSLTYDPVTDQYVYVWKTDKSWATTCRQLVVRLADGTNHYANFKFK